MDYWEGYNEPDPNMNNMPWYARFEAERVRVMAQHGLRAAIGGFATGVPEYDEFALFVPAIAVAKEHRGILTLHEYGAPDMTYLYGDPLPGLPTYPDRGSLTFRYRWFYRDFWNRPGWSSPWLSLKRALMALLATGRGRMAWAGPISRTTGSSRAGGQTARNPSSTNWRGMTWVRARMATSLALPSSRPGVWLLEELRYQPHLATARRLCGRAAMNWTSGGGSRCNPKPHCCVLGGSLDEGKG